MINVWLINVSMINVINSSLFNVPEWVRKVQSDTATVETTSRWGGFGFINKTYFWYLIEMC